MTKIIFDIGHGGRDPGATHYNEDGLLITEHEIACEVAVDTIALLTINGVDESDIKFLIVPEGESMGIEERAEILNKLSEDEDLIISLHCNRGSSEATGAEIYHHRTWGDKNMARKMLSAYCKSTNLDYRGVKSDNKTAVGGLGIMLKQPFAKKDDIVLLELGFISNDKDLRKMRSKGAEGVARAIFAALGRDPNVIEHTVIFPDVSNEHFACEAIFKLQSIGIVKGYSDGLFRPDKPITRAESAVMLDRLIKYLSKNKQHTRRHTASRP